MKAMETLKRIFKRGGMRDSVEKIGKDDSGLDPQEALTNLLTKLAEMAQAVIEETKTQQREQLIRFLELFEKQMANPLEAFGSQIQDCSLSNNALTLALVEKGLLTPEEIDASREKIKQASQETLH